MKKRPTWPRIRPRRNAGGSVSHVVDLGKFAGSDARPRRAFKSKTEAETYAAEKRRERNEGGLEAVALTEIKKTEWVHCQKLTQEKGRSILEVVQLGLQALAGTLPLAAQTSPVPTTPPTAKPLVVKTVSEVIEEYAAHLRWKNRNKRNHKNEHARISRGVLRRILLAKLDSPIASITLSDLVTALSQASAGSAHKVQGVVQILFAFAAEPGRRYLLDDVSEGLGPAVKPTPKDDEDEPEILALWEVKARLFTAQSRSEFHELIPCVSAQLFGTARLCEARRLPVLELNTSLDEVKFGPGVAKREARRAPAYHPTLKAWLRAYPPAPDGLVPANYHAKLRALRAAAGLDRGKYKPVSGVCDDPPEWGRSIFRHTYGSNFYALSQNKELTLYNMGHTNPRTFFTHYAACVKKHHAEEYWAILPLKADELVRWSVSKNSQETLLDWQQQNQMEAA